MKSSLTGQLIDVYDPRKILLSYGYAGRVDPFGGSRRSGENLCGAGGAPAFADLYLKLGLSRGSESGSLAASH